MSSIDDKLGAISDEKARAVLRKLHGKSGHEVWKILWRYLPTFPKLFSGKKLPWERLELTHDGDYLASSPGHGVYCYLLARAIGAKRMVVPNKPPAQHAPDLVKASGQAGRIRLL